MLYVAGFSTWDPCSDGLNPTWRGPTAEPTRLEHVPSHASTPNKEMSTQKVWSFCFCGSVNLLLGYTSKWVGTSVWRYVERGSKGTPTAPVRRSAESCVSLAGSHTQTKNKLGFPDVFLMPNLPTNMCAPKKTLIQKFGWNRGLLVSRRAPHGPILP